MFSVRLMCRVLMVHVSGFYAWLKEPLSLRAQEDLRQTDLIRQAWTDCGKVYGYRNGNPPIFDGVLSQNLRGHFQFLGGCDATDAHVRAVVVVSP